MSTSASAPSEQWTLSRGRIYAFTALLFIDFVLVAVMLATDVNLQTNFGAASKYYVHWWGLLAEGVLTLLAALAMVLAAMRVSKGGRGMWSSRGLVLGGLLFAIVAFIADLGIVFTYAQVGLTMSQFEQYLFGQSYYGNDIRYLYDVVLVFYALTAVVGAIAAMRVRGVAMGSPST